MSNRPRPAFTQFTLPDGTAFPVPDDITLKLPDHSDITGSLLHFLVYIPWEDTYLKHLPDQYRDFFLHVLPYLHTRTTDVHIALCLPYVQQLAARFPQAVDLRVVYTAFILHDIGWSQLTDSEIASSLGVKGLALNRAAMGPKEKHAIVGKELAQTILESYAFNPPLTPQQKDVILDAIAYHDKPWELAAGGDIPLEVKLVCDADHLWSFTRQNFWQDTVRKGVRPKDYLENLAADLDSYFITDQAKELAGSMLAQRSAEVQQLPQLQ